jgi:eukaryotic-like serine/threonine-protein kinase
MNREGNDPDQASHPTETILQAGATVGPYQIEAPLGKGGMGEVYRARDLRLGRSVALKFLSSNPMVQQDALDRFRREARAISALNHPNVCTIHDIGEDAGRPYIVMELLEGQTLKERIAEGRFSNEQLVSVMIPILEGLGAAHETGIVHRDIKPANLFLTRQGAVKILDFGLAKSDYAEAAGIEEGLTAPGTAMGTLSYMSPEQAHGRNVDARSDLFSCGVVLYQMATGALPFAGEGWAAAIDALLNRKPRPAHELNPELSPEIGRVIDRSLEKEPAARYQTAAEMRVDLLRGSRTPAEASAVKKSGRSWTYAAAGLAAIVILVGAVWYFARPKGPVTSPSEYVQLTDFSGSVSAPALSPDGRMVTFFRDSTWFLGPGQVYVKLLPDGQATQLTSSEHSKYSPVFTPDGSRVAYTSEDDGVFDTWTVPVGGGSPTLLMRNAAGLTWIGQGKILFSEIRSGTSFHMGIVTSQESRANERRIYLPEHERAMAHYSQLSPNHESVLIVEMDRTAAWQPCRLVPMDGSTRGKQVGPDGACIAAAWSPDGKWMYFNAAVNGATHIWRQRYGEAAAEQITFGPNEEEGLAVAPDGRSLISSVGAHKSSIWVHDANGERPISPEGAASEPKMSLDGERIYYLLRKNKSPGSELWWSDRATGKSNPALPGVVMTGFDISRDGQQVAFTVKNGPDYQIMIAPLDGSAPPRLVLNGGATVSFGAPGELVFRQLNTETSYLARIRTDGTGLERIQERPIANLSAVSPDGAWAAVGYADSHGHVAVSLRDRTSKPLCGGDCRPRWSPDGADLYIAMQPDATSAGRTLVVPIRRGDGLPLLPPEGLPPNMAEDPAGAFVIRQGAVAAGPDRGTYAFLKVEFVGNLFRIPLH